MKRNLFSQIEILKDLHEENQKRRNIKAVCVFSVIFIVAPIMLDLTEFSSILDFLEHVVLAIISAVLYYFVNAIIFWNLLSPGIEETILIEELEKEYRQD